MGQIELSPVKAFGVGGDVLDARWVKIAAAGQAEFVRKSKHVGAERLMPGNSCLGRLGGDAQDDGSGPPHRRNPRIVDLKVRTVVGSQMLKALDGHVRAQENEMLVMSLKCSELLLWTDALLLPCTHAVP